jgi:hypothetical protein
LFVETHGKIEDTIDYIDVSADDDNSPSDFATEMLKVVSQGGIYVVCLVWKGGGYVGCLGRYKIKPQIHGETGISDTKTYLCI